MRIKLIRNMGSGEGPVAFQKAGSQHDIAPEKANELIQRGLAEPIAEVKKRGRPRKSETEEPESEDS